MTHTTIFKSNRSQAVRLPKAVAFPGDVKKVDVITLGRARVIMPADDSWDIWFDGPQATPDFMQARQQPNDQAREAF